MEESLIKVEVFTSPSNITIKERVNKFLRKLDCEYYDLKNIDTHVAFNSQDSLYYTVVITYYDHLDISSETP